MVEINDVVRGSVGREIGLGTFPFSGVFSPVDAATAHDIVGTFLDLGGRYLETAPIYPVGDVVLGEVLADFPRDAYLLGTKCVTFPDAAGAPQTLGAPQHTRRQVESELARLGVDYLDLVATHRTPTDVSPEEAMAGLETLRAEGLVRMIGVSNASAADLASYVQGGTVDLVQNRYSLVHRLRMWKKVSLPTLRRSNSITRPPSQ